MALGVMTGTDFDPVVFFVLGVFALSLSISAFSTAPSLRPGEKTWVFLCLFFGAGD
jgi:hypothetical protein